MRCAAAKWTSARLDSSSRMYVPAASSRRRRLSGSSTSACSKLFAAAAKSPSRERETPRLAQIAGTFTGLLGAGVAGTCAVNGGETQCWGTALAIAGPIPRREAVLDGALAFARGFDYGCALEANGGLACFGEAVPAQAIAQICEVTWQLRGQATGRQVEGATAGITANQGLFGHGSSVILVK